MQVDLRAQGDKNPDSIEIGAIPILPKNDGDGKVPLGPILSNPSVHVTEMSEAEMIVRNGTYESAKRTAENMVDSPEERRRKAAQREYEEKKEEEILMTEEANARKIHGMMA